MMSSWDKHYSEADSRKLSAAYTLSFALDQFKKELLPKNKRFAIDLGCGNGTDTLALLANGWCVLAIDKELTAIDQLLISAKDRYAAELTTLIDPFSEISIPSASLINASFSLPFCRPDDFNLLWNKIIKALSPGSRFAGHFFGPEDSWSANTQMTFHQEHQVIKLFNGFSIEHWEETRRDGKTIGGAIKRWHVFHIVACYQ